MARRVPLLIATLASVSSIAVAARDGPMTVAATFADPEVPTLVVAHRACHNPAPHHGMPASIPENALEGIQRCIALGVDMAEVDVRRTRDGYLVLMHDETVDRTTDGHGAVADLSLAEIQGLRLRANEGGASSAITDARVPTLSEALKVAKGRILLNLDVQAGLYADTIATVRRAGQQEEILVKQPAGPGSPVLPDTPPFDTVPFMPILSAGDDIAKVAATQAGGRRPPIAYELSRMPASALPTIAAVARTTGTRLWANSLWTGFVQGLGGDTDALRDPDQVWGRMLRAGISVIQTDEPEALLRFLGR